MRRVFHTETGDLSEERDQPCLLERKTEDSVDKFVPEEVIPTDAKDVPLEDFESGEVIPQR